MSEQDTREAIELPNHGDLAFSALMDALAPEGEAEKAAGAGGAEGAPAVPAAAGAADTGTGGGDRPQAADAGDATPGTGADQAGQLAGGADIEVEGRPAADGEQPGGVAEGSAEQPAAPGEAAAPAARTTDVPAVAPDLANLSTKVEENLTNGYRSIAYEETRKEHGRYFEALEVHPRTLVGKQVPSMSGEGTETLQNTADAREWQEAVKATLMQEIDSRANTRMQDSRQFLETIHASIDLFKNNPDLTPGAKGFDKELADKFAALAKPYEVRIEGKLHGYSIPVQPLIDNLRMQTKPKQPAATEAKSQQEAPAPDEPPQKGISSKAPTSGEKEDFSTLFGTIGLPNLRI